MKFLSFIVLAILFANLVSGQTQTCTCESNFEWVKETFEENDAGFQYIIDKKGQRAYDIHNQLTIEKIRTADALTECTKLIYEWLSFFRSGYIRIQLLTNETSTSHNVAQPEQNSETPFMEELNMTTLYLRIPSFEYEYKSAIDTLLVQNKDKILKTENLIIDLRNNGGGDDGSFQELIPFLYTNPIRAVAVEFLSTALNNQQIWKHSTNPDFDEDTRNWAKNIYDQLQERLGNSVNPFGESVFTYQQDVVYEYPKNVGIIINEENASTTEQFLLTAKQSKKVKLFGVTTHGALDISNMNSVVSPCEEFQLWYAMSRSLRIPNMTVDDIGVQPDFYLDKNIPQDKWVEFVNEILNR